MTRSLLAIFALVLSVGMTMPEAEAKRLGGGRSTGMQRDTVTQPAATPPARSAAPAAAAQPPRKNSWLGPIAGLAAGLGLAALMSHLGMGEEFASLLLIALLVGGAVIAFRLLMRKRAAAPSMQYAGMGAGGGVTPIPEQPMPASAATSNTAPQAERTLPAGFDAEGFARQAKLNFLRLQAANDAGNLDDLREFTSPELFAEIQLQLAERGTGTQHTDVMELRAEVLECVEEAQRHIVSVRFSGLLREEAGAAPTDFAEVWHLTKPVDGSRGWTVAGIQQLG